MNAQTTIPAEILTLYTKAPDELEAVLHGVTETDLDKRLTPETWSIIKSKRRKICIPCE